MRRRTRPARAWWRWWSASWAEAPVSLPAGRVVDREPLLNRARRHGRAVSFIRPGTDRPLVSSAACAASLAM